MTARTLVELAATWPLEVGAALAVPALLALLLGLLLPRGAGGKSPWKYLNAFLVYATCVPGMFAAVLTAYTLFFTGENLLDVNLAVYLGPIVAMGLTLWLISRQASFDELPGFDRLSGLMVAIGVTFVLLLAVSRTRIWLFFGGSMTWLVAVAVGLFALLKWGLESAFRGRGEPRRSRPKLPFP